MGIRFDYQVAGIGGIAAAAIGQSKAQQRQGKYSLDLYRDKQRQAQRESYAIQQNMWRNERDEKMRTWDLEDRDARAKTAEIESAREAETAKGKATAKYLPELPEYITGEDRTKLGRLRSDLQTMAETMEWDDPVQVAEFERLQGELRSGIDAYKPPSASAAMKPKIKYWDHATGTPHDSMAPGRVPFTGDDIPDDPRVAEGEAKVEAEEKTAEDLKSYYDEIQSLAKDMQGRANDDNPLSADKAYDNAKKEIDRRRKSVGLSVPGAEATPADSTETPTPPEPTYDPSTGDFDSPLKPRHGNRGVRGYGRQPAEANGGLFSVPADTTRPEYTPSSVDDLFGPVSPPAPMTLEEEAERRKADVAGATDGQMASRGRIVDRKRAREAGRAARETARDSRDTSGHEFMNSKDSEGKPVTGTPTLPTYPDHVPSDKAEAWRATKSRRKAAAKARAQAKGTAAAEARKIRMTPAVIVRSNAEYAALPSGTVFVAPDGSRRRKP